MKIQEKYKKAKAAKVGEEFICPSCGSKEVKKHYQQAFCTSRKGTKCKDKYWNTVDPKKRNNTTRISPASARWSAFQEAQRESNLRNYIEDQEHPFSSEALGQD